MKSFNYLKLAHVVPFVALTGCVLGATYWLAVIAFSPRLAAYATAIPWVWLAISATAGHWLHVLIRLRKSVRRPVLEEELPIERSLQEVRSRMTSPGEYEVWLEEQPGLNACAMGRQTIIISTGLIRAMSPEELQAVMAHEIGHLASRDTLLSDACNLSLLLSIYLEALGVIVWYYLGRRTGQRLLLLSVITAILYWRCGWQGLGPAAALFVPRTCFPLINKLFRVLRMAESRQTEYRQDAFAQALGYGPALKQALTKIIKQQRPGAVTGYQQLFHGTHPITEHRIRRIEQLDGLRGTDGSLIGI